MNRKLRKLGHVLIFIAVVAAAIAVVMLLWNALIPTVIGWSAINFWQAAGLLLLCKLLFGGFGRHFHRHGGHGHRKGFGFGGCHHHDKREFKDIHEKMKGMSRSERRDFIRERMGKGFCDEETTSQKEEL